MLELAYAHPNNLVVTFCRYIENVSVLDFILTISSKHTWQEEGMQVDSIAVYAAHMHVQDKGKLDACAEVIKMGFLSNAPRGFSDAVSALNSLPQGVLAELVS